MDWNSILSAIWKIMNTPFGITVAATAALLLLGYLSKTRPAWSKWEGTIITAIKLAEKAIPDSTPSSGLMKLDHALRYVLRVYEEANGTPANKKSAAELKNAIQLTHAALEAKRNL